MVKYFISYEDLLENNSINKELNILSPELFIIKKVKKGEYKFQPLLYFTSIESNLARYVISLNYNKKGILMVELSKEEVEKINPIFIKKFEQVKDGVYKKVFMDEDMREKSLISYNCLVSMNAQEMDLGEVVAVMRCKSDFEKLYVSADRSALVLPNTTKERRDYLKQEEIGCDLYFHTDNEELLDKYKEDVTLLKEVEPNKYELLKHKVFVIDSIPQNRVYDFSNATRRCFYELCNKKSTPVNIIREDDNYTLTIHDVDRREKKGYIINNPNFKNILCDRAIEPLLNYINVYEFDKGIYKKISLIDYISKTSTIILNKKPSN